MRLDVEIGHCPNQFARIFGIRGRALQIQGFRAQRHRALFRNHLEGRCRQNK